ncbi:DUF448 domain-containing protein [Campylobacter jejuni]|nr:DUF448 domain-containing protein [Campylobacter sp. US33a]MCW1359987.1 DUF448 domain-containing protein [Campylobacter jejuni]TEY03202.1 DUF448 domain-containing protein [Campylobacter sp. US33a]
MCIVCKNRFEQQKLYRFQIQSSKIIKASGFGRSLYICDECVLQEKKIYKAFLRVCKTLNLNTLQQDLKEIILNGKD